MYCRYCGIEIPNNSNYCPNCGKRQSGENPKGESPLFQFFVKYKKVVVTYAVWCLIHVGLLVFSSSGPEGKAYSGYEYFYPDKIDAFYPFNKPLSNVLLWKSFWCDPLENIDVYDWSELFFYTILLPILIWGVVKVWPSIALFLMSCYHNIRMIVLESWRRHKSQNTYENKTDSTTSDEKHSSSNKWNFNYDASKATSTKEVKSSKKLDWTVLFVTISIAGTVMIGIICGAIALDNRGIPEQAQPIDTDSIEEVLDSIVEDEEYLPIDVDSIEEVVNIDDVETVDTYQVEEWTTGDTPYSKYYGDNMKCRKTECSGIKITAPETSDVVVIVKKRNEQGKVAGHVYISAGDTYKIDLPDGVYQTFFYYGDEWSPYKDMGNGVKGGFVRDEVFAKDNPQEIYSAVLSYVLQLRRDGNFQSKSSNRSEMF